MNVFNNKCAKKNNSSIYYVLLYDTYTISNKQYDVMEVIDLCNSTIFLICIAIKYCQQLLLNHNM